MNILGISAFYHDSAAALVQDGFITAAAQEERFTRIKHDPSFPRRAVDYCLREAGIDVSQVDAVVFYEKPFLKAERLLETYLATVPRGLRSFMAAIPTWLKDKGNIQRTLRREMGKAYKGPFLFTEHHESHAASAFFPSPFRDAAILTIDGVGEWATTTIGSGAENQIRIDQEIRFPHSLGLLYSAITYYTGFKVNSGEYKVMGLAPYGEPRYVQTMYDNLITVRDDGSFWLNQEFFDYTTGLTMTNDRFHVLFGGPPRVPETNLTQKEMDLAASVQVITEEIMMKLARQAYSLSGNARLCLAGGVALNCVANGKILRDGPFEDIWIQPAAGDAGGALGAALFVWHQLLGNTRTPQRNDSMRGARLGPEFGREEISDYLVRIEAPAEEIPDDELVERVARLLADEKVIGWFNGRMEFGPRALGSRSILGDARSPRMQALMNLKIKFREGFRPFAPCVLREKVSEWFNLDRDSPYMLLVSKVADEKCTPLPEDARDLWGIEKLNVPRSEVPAITHIDYSARIQTVDRERHGLYYDLIERFDELTGCPVIVNTSFNVRGEPIVCTPEEAYRCFMFTHIDVLVLGNFLLLKENQPAMAGAAEHLAQFQLD